MRGRGGGLGRWRDSGCGGFENHGVEVVNFWIDGGSACSVLGVWRLKTMPSKREENGSGAGSTRDKDVRMW